MLRIYNDSSEVVINDLNHISSKLEEIGILYKQTSSFIDTFDKIDHIKYEYSAPFYDIIFLNNKTINYSEIQKSFLREHTHTDFEMRLITHGTANFYIKHNNMIYDLTVKKYDLISIPAYTNHWFDAGDNPDFTAVRFYTDASGWVANYT